MTSEPNDSEDTGTVSVTEPASRTVVYEELAEERDLRRRQAREQIRAAEMRERERQRQKGIEARSTSPASIVTYRVGNREYPYKIVPQCKICNSPWRANIEGLLASGRTVGSILKYLPEEAGISKTSLFRHRKGHLPPALEAAVTIIESRAKELGKVIETGQGTLADEVSLARLVVQRTTERLTSGEIEPTLADGMKAGAFLSSVGAGADGDVDQQTMLTSMVRYFELIRSSMPTDQWQALQATIREDPVLHALSGRARPEIEAEPDEDEDIADAELIDSEVPSG